VLHKVIQVFDVKANYFFCFVDIRKLALDGVSMVLFHDYDGIGPVKQLFGQYGIGALVGPGGLHFEPGVVCQRAKSLDTFNVKSFC
jgi:hypothetical protein